MRQTDNIGVHKNPEHQKTFNFPNKEGKGDKSLSDAAVGSLLVICNYKLTAHTYSALSSDQYSVKPEDRKHKQQHLKPV
jgi:hypothetical protein